MKRLRIKVEGRVQGVFYRASTQSKALELGLSGWVKNQPDGSVLIEVQGNTEVLDKMIKWCKEVPIMARIDNLDQEDIPVEAGTSFDIIR